MTVVEFLLARIAEDEAVAREADANRVHVDSDLSIDTWICHEFGTHVAASPARVLAECAAKRTLIEGLLDAMEGDYAPWNEGLLETMADVYADHPDRATATPVGQPGGA